MECGILQPVQMNTTLKNIKANNGKIAISGSV